MGAGRAIIDGDYTYYHGFDGQYDTNYIDIEYFNVTRQGRPNSDSLKSGMILVHYSHDWIIKDCILYKPEGWDIISPMGADDSPYSDQDGIRIYVSENIEIDGVEIFALGRDAIRVFASKNVFIHHSDIGGINRGIETGYFSVAIRIYSSGGEYKTDNIQISNSTIHDGWQYEGDDSAQRSHAGDWIHIYGDQTANVIIEKCFFYNNKEFDNAYGTATVFMEWAGTSHITLKNNLFINSHPIGGGIAIAINHVKIFNNTFVNYNHTNEGSWFVNIKGTLVPESNSIYILNNIFVQLSENNYYAVRIEKSNFSGIIDYNTYFKKEDLEYLVFQNGKSYNFTEWQAEGYDENGFFGNPNFLSLPETGATSGEGKYQLSSSSLNEIGNGAVITEVTDDFWSTPRLGTYDIGAYQTPTDQIIQKPIKIRIK